METADRTLSLEALSGHRERCWAAEGKRLREGAMRVTEGKLPPRK